MLLKVVAPEEHAVLMERHAHVARADFRSGNTPFDPLTVVTNPRALSSGLDLLQRVVHDPALGVQPRPSRPLEHHRCLERLRRNPLTQEMPGPRMAAVLGDR